MREFSYLANHQYRRGSQLHNNLTPLKLAVAIVGMVSYERSFARDGETPKPLDLLGLEEVVVTATPYKASKLETSLSISSFDDNQLRRSATFNIAELLRSVPGIRSESSGGEGNANITVRGVPISAGGARYVQFQEEGLPALQFGDIAFATADQFVRVGPGIDRVEVVRGGSASTTATNAPGGIINVINQTGVTPGGSAALSTGLDYNQFRYDFSYGQPLANSNTRFFVAGFYRRGEGVRESDLDLEKGGQLKANITHDFEQGFIRISGKYLRDYTPTFLPVPVQTSNGTIQALPGVDPRYANFYTTEWNLDPVLNRDNQILSTNINDGLLINSQSIGAHLNYPLTETIVLDNKFRLARNHGRFTGIFPADNGFTDGPFTIASGPRSGQNFDGSVFTATTFNVDLNDLSNITNDLFLSKEVDINSNSFVKIGGGLFYSVQTLDLTWNFNQYLLSLSGSNQQLISNGSTSTTYPGLIAQGTEVFGGCCNRTYDIDHTTVSPYINTQLVSGRWTLDISVRQDNQSAKGFANQAVAQSYTSNNRQDIDYQVDHLSYSLGTNFSVTANMAMFTRFSSGVSFNDDRILFNGFGLDGSEEIPVNEVRQQEAGIKWKQNNINIFITLFHADTTETNYEATTQTFTDREYDAYGLEIESAYQYKSLQLLIGSTYTDSEITKAENLNLEGNTPRRQADWTYQIQPSFSYRNWQLGLSMIGTTKSYGDDNNTLTLDGYTLFNGFINYQINKQLDISLLGNNLGNTTAYTEVEASGHAARAINGRSTQANITYTF